MTAVHEQYTEEMRRQFGYLAAWLPSIRLRLGDVGVLRGSRFDHITTLAELGIAFGTRQHGASGDLEYASAGQVDIEWGGGAAVTSGIHMGVRTLVTVHFRRSHATLFQAVGCATEVVADLVALESALVGSPSGQWRREWSVVTEVVRARSAAVFVSSSSGGRVDLEVDGAASGAPLPLAHAAARARVASESGMAARVISSTGLTPLFRVCALRGGMVRNAALVYRGEETDETSQGAVAATAVLPRLVVVQPGRGEGQHDRS